MNNVLRISSLLLIIIICGSFKPQRLVQNVEVYGKENFFYAIGEVDRKVYKSSRSAQEVIQFAIDRAPTKAGKFTCKGESICWISRLM
jgi:hypothetical protein